MTYFERRLVYLSSHFPEKFTEAGQFKARGEATFSTWELGLVRAARKFPVALEMNKIHNKYFEAWRSLSRYSIPEEPSPTPPSLPKLPTDRSHWFLDPTSGDFLANGETLSQPLSVDWYFEPAVGRTCSTAVATTYRGLSLNSGAGSVS
jgi:hypothetical protein